MSVINDEALRMSGWLRENSSRIADARKDYAETNLIINDFTTEAGESVRRVLESKDFKSLSKRDRAVFIRSEVAPLLKRWREDVCALTGGSVATIARGEGYILNPTAPLLNRVAFKSKIDVLVVKALKDVDNIGGFSSIETADFLRVQSREALGYASKQIGKAGGVARFRRTVTGSDPCDFCLSRAGQVESLPALFTHSRGESSAAHFHSGCTCSIHLVID